MGIEDAAWESLYPGAEGAGEVSRFWSPPKAESLRNPYIPAPKAPGKSYDFGLRKTPNPLKSLYPGPEDARS